MAKRKPREEISQTEWEGELREARPETGVPGYWANLQGQCEQWAKDVSVCPYWTGAANRLTRWRNEYGGGALLAASGLPGFDGKKEERIRRKLYEECVKNERSVDDMFPVEGPPVPRLGDLVRTRVACKFIDGVEFVAERLYELAAHFGANPKRAREGRVEGYFAQHINFESDVYYRFGGATRPCKVICEIQVATELATRVWEATHPIYEVERELREGPEHWQWDAGDPRFISHQLGHMIHLADGLILQLREAAVSGKAERKPK